MFSFRFCSVVFGCCLIVQFFELGATNTSKDICNLRTDEIIELNGYQSERHTVTTADGYILTMFRCNSKRFASNKNKKAIIIQHGLLSSSDEFCLNKPSQGLAYVFADAGYDVWLSNSRGNVYSRNHTTKDPNNAASGFWNFSWYELGIYDYPSVIDYVRQETHNAKMFVIAHSQGATALLTLLAERPEYNQYITAASLLAPVAYIEHADAVKSAIGDALPHLESFKNTEFLPRPESVSNIHEARAVCMGSSICGQMMHLLFGPSDRQRNDTLMEVIMCHTPNGASVNQILHYGQQSKYGFFGKFINDQGIPADFRLETITTPLKIHYSPSDNFMSRRDIDKLIRKLRSSLVSTQTVNDFNHVDFVSGIDAASIVYSEILKFFKNYQ